MKTERNEGSLSAKRNRRRGRRIEKREGRAYSY